MINVIRDLARFRVVLVTGPQRSGTRIAAHMCANDLNYGFIDERAFKETWLEAFSLIVKGVGNCVIQCPGMCRHVHMFGGLDWVAVVLMRRKIEDIIASQERIGWQYEEFELSRYDKGPGDGPIAKVKYDFWDQRQRAQIVNAYELEFETLSAHPMWIHKEERKTFKPGQWRACDPRFAGPLSR